MEEKIMKRRIGKVMALIGTAALVMGSMAGCGNTQTGSTTGSSTAGQTGSTVSGSAAGQTGSTAAQTESSSTTDSSAADISGSIQMVGSTSMEKLANAVAESFMEI